MVGQSHLSRRCHTSGQLVLGGTAFADTVTVDADDRAHRYRGEHQAQPRPDISAYTFVGTMAMQTNRTNQKTRRQPR
jgi:hypothetical protein